MALPRCLALLVVTGAIVSCIPTSVSKTDAASDGATSAVQSPMPADRLAQVRAALPKVAFPRLQAALDSNQTVWYDDASMKPSYQLAVSQDPPFGANSNDRWFDTVNPILHPIALNFYDPSKHQWRFPFATTAGTDNSTNVKVVNFLSLPAKDGKLLPLAVYAVNRPNGITGYTLNSWGWVYPNGTMIGEILFVTTASGDLLPSEIRTRVRFSSGWGTNAYRPFATASALSQAIKQRRPNWQSTPALTTLVNHLDGDSPLTATSLHAPQLPGVIDQDGAVDVLPDFADDALVKDLLTQTPFASSYGTTWKSSGGQVAYAASTASAVSIVPTNYQGGAFPVDEQSCMRCHKEAGRSLTQFRSDFGQIALYGEMWGRDGIFSFHPFEESRYNQFLVTGTTDNRSLSANLFAQGIVATYSATVHSAPDYPTLEVLEPATTPPAPGSTSDSSDNTNTNTSTQTNGGGVAVNTGSGANTTSSTNSNVIEFHIPAGTGSGEWNLQGTPVVASRGQIVRIINDDATAHVLHTDGEPCPHGDIGNPVQQGDHYDCQISQDADSGVYKLWDHNLGGPSAGRFWITVQ